MNIKDKTNENDSKNLLSDATRRKYRPRGIAAKDDRKKPGPKLLNDSQPQPTGKRIKSQLNLDGTPKKKRGPNKPRTPDHLPLVKRVNASFRRLAEAHIKENPEERKRLGELLGMPQYKFIHYIEGKTDRSIWPVYAKLRALALGMGWDPSKFVGYLEGELNEAGSGSDLTSKITRLIEQTPQENLGILTAIFKLPREKLSVIGWFIKFLSEKDEKTLASMKCILDTPIDGVDVMMQLLSIKSSIARPNG